MASKFGALTPALTSAGSVGAQSRSGRCGPICQRRRRRRNRDRT